MRELEYELHLARQLAEKFLKGEKPYDYSVWRALILLGVIER